MKGWEKQAACRGMDPELFMVDPRKKLQVQEAKEVCRYCPVRDACLDFYLEHGLFEDKVVAGGMTHKERLRLIHPNRTRKHSKTLVSVP